KKYGKQQTLVDLKGEPKPGRTRADIALGRYPVAPSDLATVYATLVGRGNRTDPPLPPMCRLCAARSWSTTARFPDCRRRRRPDRSSGPPPTTPPTRGRPVGR